MDHCIRAGAGSIVLPGLDEAAIGNVATGLIRASGAPHSAAWSDDNIRLNLSLPADAASPEQLIDVNQTREFPDYCRGLLAAQRGNLSCQKQLLEHGRAAVAHMDVILAGMGKVASGFDAAAGVYSRDELKIIRNGSTYTQKIGDKMIHNFMLLAMHLFKGLHGVAEITTAQRFATHSTAYARATGASKCCVQNENRRIKSSPSRCAG